jgi:hypothetical protein
MYKILSVLALLIGLAIVTAGCSFHLSIGASKNLDLRLKYMIGVDVNVHHEQVNLSETNVVTFKFQVPATYNIRIEPADAAKSSGSTLVVDVTIDDVKNPVVLHPQKLADPFKITVTANGVTETHQYGWGWGL